VAVDREKFLPLAVETPKRDAEFFRCGGGPLTLQVPVKLMHTERRMALVGIEK
jgi:hypothetical protein